MKEKAFLIWFTGLSGSGKSTLSQGLSQKLAPLGIQTFLLDGDKIRQGLCKDLGFSKADRTENIRRAAEMAKLLVASGISTIAAFMSPQQKDRAFVRNLFSDHCFIEIYCKCPFAICEYRDVKGIYKKARAGEIKNVIGLDESYEEPINPELIINTDLSTIDESVDQIMLLLVEKGLLAMYM